MTFDVEEVLQKLTIKQKAHTWQFGSLKEYSVPSLRCSDGPNGVRGSGIFNPTPSACFPCGTAMGATFNSGLLEQAGKLMADEAKAKGVHTILGPTVNIQRSPLGGRGFESFSEDPVLSGSAAASIIGGIQSNGIQATIKHFVCNDQEHERLSVSSDVSERALREIYLTPFQIAIRDSDPKWIMTAYNKVNGVHASQHPLLQALLRNEWSWKGGLMSDWGGTYSTTESIRAGLDVEMPGKTIWRGDLISHTVNSQELYEFEIDKRARKVLELVKDAFEKSGVPENAPEKQANTPETAKFLRQLAGESMVLLKNEKNILPFSKGKKTAVIGPNGKYTSFCGGGSAALVPYYATSALEGISSKCDKEVEYVFGINSFRMVPPLYNLEIRSGERGFIATTYDRPASDPNRKKVDEQKMTRPFSLMEDYFPSVDGENFYIDFEGYFTPDITGDHTFSLTVIGTGDLYVDDKLVIDNSSNQRLGTYFSNLATEEEKGSVFLEAGRRYKITVLFGSVKTSKVTLHERAIFSRGGFRIGGALTFNAEDELERAIRVAKEVDQVVLVVGLNPDIESEGFDRSTMDLPPGTDKLVSSVLAVNSNCVVVLNAGSAMSMPWIDDVNAVVQAWYGGNEGGNGIADVLFGDINPSGKLPLSFPKRVEDNPAYLHFRAENGHTLYGEGVYVGYRYYEAVKRDVLFPFGHGLSYTTFEYSNLTVKVSEERGEQLVKAIVDVTNIGTVPGKESVQLYVSQLNPSIGRPMKELKGFGKTAVLKAGKTETIEISVPLKYATSFWDESRHSWVSQSDDYSVHIASSSSDVRLVGKFKTLKNIYWKGL
jgi:beta-glucosidase